ncbi:MAG TPA: MraY family glycosyltransferase [Bacteroidia bacterium]|nr:MraY family glycosyltransferase [Bacteroidia bacterium]
MSVNKYIVLIYGIFFICATIFSLLINGLFVKFSKTLGIRPLGEPVIRWGSLSKPSFGGISFYMVFLFSVASYSIFFEQSEILLNNQLLGIMLAATIAFLMGLADDAYNTKPFLKFSAQITCAIVLIATGTFIHAFEENYLNYLFTIFWIVAIMNSINMLDNMDAITTIVSIFILLTALLVTVINGDVTNMFLIILIGVMAALIGFLFYNWHPSKIYMGDTGSQFLGVFLGAIGIIYFWNYNDDGSKIVFSENFYAILMVFIVPIIDTSVVVINRLYKGKSPFIGGKDHTTHHLSYIGFSDRKVALTFATIALLSSFFTLLIVKFINWDYIYMLVFGLYFLLLFSFFLYLTILRNKKLNNDELE